MAMLAGLSLAAGVDNPSQAETVIVSTFVGGVHGYADGVGENARFSLPTSVVADAAGNLYVSDSGNRRIRKVTPKGEVSTFVGGGDNYYGDFADGKGENARFRDLGDIAIDSAGNLYVADAGNGRIRKVTPDGEVTTLAGRGGAYYYDDFNDGEGSVAKFNSPSGIAIDAAGNLYVADMGNQRIRKIVIQRP